MGYPRLSSFKLSSLSGVEDLETVSNNCGVDGWGLGVLLAAKRIRRTISSYVGENKEFERQFLSGELEVELVPQGSLAERLRAGGAGIPAFYTPAGVGTQVAEGGLPWRYDGAGGVAMSSPPKEVREFDGASYVMERAIRTDFALVHARFGDRHGNLIYEKMLRKTLQPPLQGCGGSKSLSLRWRKWSSRGQLDPMHVHTPGIYVQRVVHVPNIEKRVERRTVRAPRAEGSA